jgi:hypothetical protein
MRPFREAITLQTEQAKMTDLIDRWIVEAGVEIFIFANEDEALACCAALYEEGRDTTLFHERHVLKKARIRYRAGKCELPVPISPRSYLHILAWGNRMGSNLDFIRTEQERAFKDRAPIDATFKNANGEWHTARDIQDEWNRKALENSVKVIRGLNAKAV